MTGVTGGGWIMGIAAFRQMATLLALSAAPAGMATAQDTAPTTLAPVSCLIEAVQLIRVSTPVAGIIAETPVGRGDTVTKGQVLARLESQIERIAVEAAEVRAADDTQIAALQVRVAYLAQQADRIEALAARNAVTKTTAREARLEADLVDKELDQARLAKRLAALELADARARLDQKILRSPIDGVIVEKLLNPGEYRDGETHIASIAKLDVLHVEAFVPISYYRHLSIGQSLRVLPEPPMDHFVIATISVIDRVFDAATATFGLRLTLPNPDLAIPAGLRCEIYFDGD